MLNTITICKEFGWDYYTYIKQPQFYIESLHNYYIALKEYEDKHG